MRLTLVRKALTIVSEATESSNARRRWTLPTPPPLPDGSDFEPATCGRVLVIDDNDGVRRYVARYLEDCGFEVWAASSGSEGLDAFMRTTFAVVFIDLNMPNMPGHTTAMRMRNYEQDLGLKRTPIIALISQKMVDHAQLATASGMNDSITKPVSRADLINEMQRWTRLAIDAETTMCRPRLRGVG